MMRAKVIVDSRNVHGQSRQVLGVGSCPTVQGVIDGFGAFGFDVVSVEVGLALARPRDQIALQLHHETNTQYKLEIESDARGKPLLGELHLRDGVVEEKIVDVQCALSIALSARDISDGKANYEAIIVCSQDVDLRPALEYAESLGVPIWVAAYDVVHLRSQPFILLTNSVMRTFRSIAQVTGHERRTLIAAAAMNPDMREWELVEPTRDGSTWFLLDSVGTPGRCPTRELTSMPTPGSKVMMGVRSVFMGKNGNDFPILSLGRKVSKTPLASEGTVIRRRRELEIEIDYRGDRRRASYHLGGVLPGTKVAVMEHTTPSGQKKMTVLGPTSWHSATNSRKVLAIDATPIIVTSTGIQLGKTRTKVTSAVGAFALAHVPGRIFPKGERVGAVLAEVGVWGKFPVAFPISSRLP